MLDEPGAIIRLAETALRTNLTVRADRSWSHGESRVIEATASNGRAKRDVQLRDVDRMWQQWQRRPALRDAYFQGYGRGLTEPENHALHGIGAAAAATTVLWARRHGDAAFEAHGWERLRMLREGS